MMILLQIWKKILILWFYKMVFQNGFLYFIPNCSVSVPVKDKFAICISADDNIFYLVNSCDERRPYSHELDHVVYIEKRHFASLRHRSYINIKNIKNLSVGDLSVAEARGLMSNDLWLKIKSMVSNSKVVQVRYKDIIARQNKARA